MSGKTDVQFFYVVVTTNENPGSNQSLASVRVLFDGGADGLLSCRTHANTFCALQHDFVRVQARFTPCNTISYMSKHVLHLATQFRTRVNLCCIVGTTLPPWPNGCFPNIPTMCYKQMDR